jgi:hypothetical protein
LQLKIDASALDQTFNIAGSDQAWKDKIKAFCAQQRLNVEHLIHAGVDLLHAHLGAGRRKSLANRTWLAFDSRRTPQVPDFLRRIVAYLMALLKRGEPIPIMT